MPDLYDLAKMTVSGTPGTGAVTLSVAVSGFLTFAQAGVPDGAKVPYTIFDGVSVEHGVGTYSSTGPSLTRDVVRRSTGTSNIGKISATSSALVAIAGGAEDIIPIQDRILSRMRMAGLLGGKINSYRGISDPYANATSLNIAGSTNVDTSTAGQVSPAAGSDVTPGGTFTASEYYTGQPASYAFDDNNATSWYSSTSATAWLQVQLSAAQVAVKYTMTADDTQPERTPNTWTLKASNTGAFAGEEVTLDTQTAVASWVASEKRTYDIASPASYLYYRITATNKAGAFGKSAEYKIAEVELLPQPSMVLKSAAFSAASAPNAARLSVLVDVSSSPTINTDLVGKVSRDGGANLQTVSFRQMVTLESGAVLYGSEDADLSALPTGTSMFYQLETHNSKSFPILGADLTWS